MYSSPHEPGEVYLQQVLSKLPGVRPLSIHFTRKSDSWMCALEVDLGIEHLSTLRMIRRVLRLIASGVLEGEEEFITQRKEDVVAVSFSVDMTPMCPGRAAMLFEDVLMEWSDVEYMSAEVVDAVSDTLAILLRY